jgi:hypothetical protein
LKVTQMELNFCHAEMSFIILGIVLKCLLIVLIGGLVVTFCVFCLSKNETEIGFQHFNLLTKSWQLSLLRFDFAIEYLLSCTAELFA